MKALWLALFLVACSGAAPQPIVDPVIVGTCETACANLQKLGCTESEPTEDNVSCVEFCKAEIVGTYDLVCVSNVSGCESVDSCKRIL